MCNDARFALGFTQRCNFVVRTPDLERPHALKVLCFKIDFIAADSVERPGTQKRRFVDNRLKDFQCALNIGEGNHTRNTILPKFFLSSILRCASAASASGKTLSITGRSLPDSKNFKTSCNSRFVPKYEPCIVRCRE